MMRFNLSSPVTEISHVARGVAAQFKHLGVLTVEDLLFYFPARYDDLSKITPIKEARIGERVVLRGRVELIEAFRSKYRHKLLTSALVSDTSGAIRVVWFSQPWISKILKSGDEVYLVGEVKEDQSGAHLLSPSWEKVSRKEAIHAARIVPVYPSTEKLSQKQIRFLMRTALPLAFGLHDQFPEILKERYKLMSLREALPQIHFPQNELRLEAARRRFKFEELLRFQLFAQQLKRELKNVPAPQVQFQEEKTKQFVEALPFKLTDAQRKAAWEIIVDMGKPQPMNRLLEGDVGSGKTVVVAIAALNAVLSKGQVAIMAPTEILARQHFNTFSKMFVPFGMRVEFRVGSEKKKSGIIESEVVVGTHALIQESVHFKDLILAVIDEQHRFGVSQRAALKEKRDDGKMPHLLSLTATPIPRSLALVFYGDLDISILREMPKGRQKIETEIVSENGRASAHEFVRGQVQAGHQVFWTCPIIDPSDVLGVKAATEVFEHLKAEIFKDLKIGLLHGRMKSKEREKVMAELLDKKIDILVATPVIEVGIDVPNATVMVIEGAERFGLAQLHQFRGRVGRGEAQSYCLLMVEDGKEVNPHTSGGVGVNARLKAFLESNDGFELAKRDLALRGPGEVYGTAQSGFPEFKIASFADVDIAKEAKEAAQWLLEKDPELLSYPELKTAILDREMHTHLE